MCYLYLAHGDIYDGMIYHGGQEITPTHTDTLERLNSSVKQSPKVKSTTIKRKMIEEITYTRQQFNQAIWKQLLAAILLFAYNQAYVHDHLYM